MDKKIEVLKAISDRRVVDKNSMEYFSDLIAINVGVAPKPFYPKLKDENGKNVKNEKGQDLRSEHQGGWTHTFVEFETAKMIKFVMKNKMNLELLDVVSVSGHGYDIKGSNMFFLEKNVQVSNTLK